MAELLMQNVSVQLGGRLVLDNVDVRTTPGCVFGVLGPNGAGKTTLLRAALGLVDYAGSVRVGGAELATLEPLERAKQVAYVPQRSLLSAPLSVEQVVEHGRYAYSPAGVGLTAVDKRAVAQALSDCDLQSFKSRRFTELSGGEQRRVLLARALATQASLILLDEPTAALDIPHALRFCRLVRELAQAGRSIVVVLHNLDEARQMCDRVLLLQEGRVHIEGKVDECISEGPVREVFGVELLRDRGFAYRLPPDDEPNRGET